MECTRWKHNICIFLGSQSISQLGSSLVDYAIIWHVTLETKSSIMMSLSMLFVFIPKIIISFFAGVWADRYSRKHLIIYTDLFIAVITVLFGVIFYYGVKDLWLIFLVLFFRSIGTGIQLPATKAIIPNIVPGSKILKVNGINSSLDSIINILSPAIGGIVLSYYTLDIIAYIDFVTALIAVILLSKMNIMTKVKNAANSTKASYFGEFRYSLNYLKHNVVVRKLLTISIVLIFLIMPLILLTPLKITREFGEEVWRLSLYESIFGIGSILGGILVAFIIRKQNNILLICICFFIIGLSCFLISSRFIVLIMFAGLNVGLFVAIANSTAMAVIQKNTDLNYLGRIMGLTHILAHAFQLLGLITFGILGDIIPVDYIFLILGALYILYSSTIFVRYRKENLV